MFNICDDFGFTCKRDYVVCDKRKRDRKPVNLKETHRVNITKI